MFEKYQNKIEPNSNIPIQRKNNPEINLNLVWLILSVKYLPKNIDSNITLEKPVAEPIIIGSNPYIADKMTVVSAA